MAKEIWEDFLRERTNQNIESGLKVPDFQTSGGTYMVGVWLNRRVSFGRVQDMLAFSSARNNALLSYAFKYEQAAYKAATSLWSFAGVATSSLGTEQERTEKRAKYPNVSKRCYN